MAVERFGKFDILITDGIGRRIHPSTYELMGGLLESNLHLARDKADKLYVFENGVYRFVEKDLYRCCMAVYAAANPIIPWTTTKDNAIIDYLVKRVPSLIEQPLSDRINLKNGIYYIYENKFEPHSEVDHSSYLTDIQLPIVYNPNAKCPSIYRFMGEVLPGGEELLFDVIGVCMTSDTRLHKAIILLGGGSNGKSIYLYGLRAAVGVDNVSTVPMHVLADSKDRFSNYNLVGKLVNAADDMLPEKLTGLANIKSIISGNPIRVEGKYRDATTHRTFCKLVFATNHRLDSEDTTIGYARRIMYIPFEQTFDGNPSKEKELQEMFRNEEEMSGLFNEVLKRLSDTLSSGFSIPSAVLDKVENYDPFAKDLEAWLRLVAVECKGYNVPIYDFYVLQSISSPHVLSRDRLAKYILRTFPRVTVGKPRIEGKQVRCFINLRIVDEELNRYGVIPEDEIDSEGGYAN